MNREELMSAVREQMPERRWQHTLGVMETAVELAKRFGADSDKADLASILHDVCKYWPVEKQADVLRQNGISGDILDYDKELWHAPAGAFIAQRKYGVHDKEVLDAIRWHTSGREHMTLLDKVVWLADYIEPGRDFPGVDEVRAIAEKDLDRALLSGLDRTIHFLLEKGKRIYPITVLARNSILQQVKEAERLEEQG